MPCCTFVMEALMEQGLRNTDLLDIRWDVAHLLLNVYILCVCILDYTLCNWHLNKFLKLGTVLYQSSTKWLQNWKEQLSFPLLWGNLWLTYGLHSQPILAFPTPIIGYLSGAIYLSIVQCAQVIFANVGAVHSSHRTLVQSLDWI